MVLVTVTEQVIVPICQKVFENTLLILQFQ